MAYGIQWVERGKAVCARAAAAADSTRSAALWRAATSRAARTAARARSSVKTGFQPFLLDPAPLIESELGRSLPGQSINNPHESHRTAHLKGSRQVFSTDITGAEASHMGTCAAGVARLARLAGTALGLARLAGTTLGLARLARLAGTALCAAGTALRAAG